MTREKPGFARSSKPAGRALLTHFLKSRRAALQPADVGLATSSSKRRTPGLRRSEVARLAGISTEWYTLFEMGRDRAMTQRAMRPIARTLRLTDVEREYLSDLVRAEPPPRPSLELAPPMRRLLEDDEKIVIVYDRWLNAVHWNDVARAISGIDPAHAGSTNLIRRLLGAFGKIRYTQTQREGRAQFFLGLFRRALARDPANAEAHRIVASLRTITEFETIWERHQIYSLDDEARVVPEPLRIHDPQFGEIRYFTMGLPIPGSAGGHVRIAVPVDDSGRALLRTAASTKRESRSA